MRRIKDIKSGYCIIEYKQYEKYKGYTYVWRCYNDLDEANYNARSMTRADGVTYAVYSIKDKDVVRFGTYAIF